MSSTVAVSLLETTEKVTGMFAMVTSSSLVDETFMLVIIALKGLPCDAGAEHVAPKQVIDNDESKKTTGSQAVFSMDMMYGPD